MSRSLLASHKCSSAISELSGTCSGTTRDRWEIEYIHRTSLSALHLRVPTEAADLWKECIIRHQLNWQVTICNKVWPLEKKEKDRIHKMWQNLLEIWYWAICYTVTQPYATLKFSDQCPCVGASRRFLFIFIIILYRLLLNIQNAGVKNWYYSLILLLLRGAVQVVLLYLYSSVYYYFALIP